MHLLIDRWGHIDEGNFEQVDPPEVLILILMNLDIFCHINNVVSQIGTFFQVIRSPASLYSYRSCKWIWAYNSHYEELRVSWRRRPSACFNFSMYVPWAMWIWWAPFVYIFYNHFLEGNPCFCFKVSWQDAWKKQTINPDLDSLLTFSWSSFSRPRNVPRAFCCYIVAHIEKYSDITMTNIIIYLYIEY